MVIEESGRNLQPWVAIRSPRRIGHDVEALAISGDDACDAAAALMQSHHTIVRPDSRLAHGTLFPATPETGQRTDKLVPAGIPAVPCPGAARLSPTPRR